MPQPRWPMICGKKSRELPTLRVRFGTDRRSERDYARRFVLVRLT